jgi:hypothetical protein
MEMNPTLLVRDIDTASRTIVPMYTSTPAVKKAHFGKGPFIRASAPTPVVKMDAACIVDAPHIAVCLDVFQSIWTPLSSPEANQIGK